MGSHLHRKTPQTEIQAKKNRDSQLKLHSTLSLSGWLLTSTNIPTPQTLELEKLQILSLSATSKSLAHMAIEHSATFGNIRLRESHLTVSTHQYQ
eukprot:scaffold958_cov128-Skeletonema_dohrnii-CCMP3373.AAC.19